jgi:OmpA-OmpF porin, OOP family
MDGKQESAAPSETKSAAEPSAPTTASSAPTSRKEWANYDFVPGARTIFFTDFSDDQVGNFPKRLTFKTGQMEVVELDGQRALKASSSSDLIIPLPEALPSKFTIELDVINRNSRGVAATTFDLTGGSDLRDTKVTQVGWGHNGLSVNGGGVEMYVQAKDADRQRYTGKPASFRILADGSALKLYADEKRIANIPNAAFGRGRALVLRLEGRDDENNAVYVTRIRVAESQKDIYDELSEKGRWTTQGILFETGKSDLKPESTPTLKSIAATLKAHPELKVEIQGHTDNVGSAGANLTLSQARADAVKNALVSDYGASDDQLTAKGYGDTKPVAKNTTQEGRANNRRVEVVKR